MLLNTGCFISIKTKLFLLKTNGLKFTRQKFEHKNQRNKRFIKLFTNVQYASPWLHGTHQSINIPPP